MVVAAQSEIRQLCQGQARIEAKLDRVCEDNEDQHRQARDMITSGLDKVHTRLNLIIGGGVTAMLGVIAYLVIYGAPWVTKDQYQSDVKTIIQEMRIEERK